MIVIKMLARAWSMLKKGELEETLNHPSARNYSSWVSKNLP